MAVELFTEWVDEEISRRSDEPPWNGGSEKRVSWPAPAGPGCSVKKDI